MREVFGLKPGRVYNGGTANMVERLFNTSRERILYVGDHVFTDVSIAKASNRWRTLLVLQELEDEVRGLARSVGVRKELKALLARKDKLADLINHLRIHEARLNAKIELGESRGGGGGSTGPDPRDAEKQAYYSGQLGRLVASMVALDEDIVGKLRVYGGHVNEKWGYLSRAGFSDKSHLMRQVEKYADVYTSRVSNLLRYTPYAYFRAGQQSLAHDGSELANFLKQRDREAAAAAAARGGGEEDDYELGM